MKTIALSGRIDSHLPTKRNFNLDVVEKTPNYYDLDISKCTFISSQAYEVIKLRKKFKTIVNAEQLKYLIN